MSDTAHSLILLLTTGKVEVMQRFIIDAVKVDDILFADGVFLLKFCKCAATTVLEGKAVARQRNPALHRKLERLTGKNSTIIVDQDAP